MKDPWLSLQCDADHDHSDEFSKSVEGLRRRDFVRLLGASAAALALSSCRRPETHLVPFDRAVEWAIPGKFLYYATSMPSASGAQPLLIATVDGRPIKVEGNPLHPAAGRGSSGFAQAAIAELYHPGRARSIVHYGREVAPSDFQSFLEHIRAQYHNFGKGLAILTAGALSPTEARLRAQLVQDFPGMLWANYEPFSSENSDLAYSALKDGDQLIPQFERADIVVALDSDFLNPAETALGFSRGFHTRRNPDHQTASPMNRLYVAESYVSLTGGMADHRLRVKASEIGSVLFALTRAVLKKVPDSLLMAAYKACPSLAGIPDPRWIKACSEDLLANYGRSLIWVGEGQPAYVHALAIALNRAFGNLGSTVNVVRTGRRTNPHYLANIETLAEKIRSNEIQHLLILNGNPAYDAPADLNFSSLLSQVPESCHFSLFTNETSRLSQWHIPAAHFLESWGDAFAFDGTISAIQPMILPLWKGWSALQILSVLAGESVDDGPDTIRKTFLSYSSEDGWTEFLRSGFLKESAWPVVKHTINASVLLQTIQRANPPDSTGTELVFLRSSNVDDGRFAENAWLQETPDFATKLVWDNAALVAPITASRLKICDGDVLEINAGDSSIRVPALIAPAHAEDSIAIALGYGRAVPIEWQANEDPTTKTHRVGFDAYPLRTTGSFRFRCNVQLRSTAERHSFARTEITHAIQGKDLVRQTNLKDYVSLANSKPQLKTQALSSPQWAMAVDLSACIGCNACLVACQAENNVPVVGKEQVSKGRDMAWIRIDRYFVGEPETAELIPQMVTCQHCENAPCEPVCPVNATVHSEEGLNLMVYNRCIGTRYCSNNCPWKVRRFNFFDYNERPLNKLEHGPLTPSGMAESMKLSKNPNVTVRMRGVMEKCTFCIQRIEEAKISRLIRAGTDDPEKLPLPPFQTACQQACPAGAIVFGNEADSNSWVARLRSSPRGYTMLESINTRPRITYLTRIKNPHGKLPACI